jgi:hypothetical protein
VAYRNCKSSFFPRKSQIGHESRRCSFDKELKDLSSIFNWYDEEILPFSNPIRRKYFKAG